MILSRKGRYQEAIDAFNRDIELNPEFPDVWHNKGIALEKLGKHKEASEAYNKAAKIESCT